MYLLTDISRAHSSGSESSSSSSFETLEAAVHYITNDWYDGFCTDYEYPLCWDADDMGMPFPTKEEFTQTVVEKISQIGKKNRWSLSVFAPYSQFCRLVPNEITLSKIK